MWKLQKSSDNGFLVLALSGQFEGDQIEDLKRIFDAEASGRQLALDLREVKLVDQDVVAFLASCEADGIRLDNCPAYIREWINRR
jgi:ABC-type transporter Mla MlaB component